MNLSVRKRPNSGFLRFAFFCVETFLGERRIYCQKDVLLSKQEMPEVAVEFRRSVQKRPKMADIKKLEKYIPQEFQYFYESIYEWPTTTEVIIEEA